jgi:hypothetical protein
MQGRSSIIVLLLLLLHGSAIGARPAPDPFEKRCEREMRPAIDVSVAPIGYRVVNSVSSARLMNRSTHGSMNDLMLGLTEIHIESEVLFDAPGLVDAAGARECVAPVVTVTLTLPPLGVFIAREFSPNSCSYREVLAHEMRHVQIYRSALPLLEQQLRAALAGRFGNRPVYAARGQGMRTLAREVDDWLRPMIRAGLAAIERAQAELDSPEEDARMSHACQGEVALNVTSAM